MDRPVPKTLEILKCGSTANAACIFCTRFERVIHSISADLALHKLLFFFPYAMLVGKRKKNEGGISTFTLLNSEMSSGFAQVQVSFHYQGKELCGFEKDILDFFIVRFDKSAVS